MKTMKPTTIPWNEIRAKHSKASPEVQARTDSAAVEEAARLRTVTKLDELRRAQNLSQTRLAELLETNQGGVSRLERQTDLHVSTLRKYIHAAGGSLKIIAQFPAAEPIELDLFSDITPPVRRKSAEVQPAKVRRTLAK